jgi:RimJ/RimL family protein N-acetyltransferase
MALKLELLPNDFVENNIKSLRRISFRVKAGAENYALTEDGRAEILAIFTLSNITADRSMFDLSFGVAPDHRQKGYATVGVKMLRDKIKTRNDIRMVSVIPFNPISCKVCKNANIPVDSEFDNMGDYAIRNPEYIEPAVTKSSLQI